MPTGLSPSHPQIYMMMAARPDGNSKRRKSGGFRCPDCCATFGRERELLRHFMNSRARSPSNADTSERDYCSDIRDDLRGESFEVHFHRARQKCLAPAPAAAGNSSGPRAKTNLTAERLSLHTWCHMDDVSRKNHAEDVLEALSEDREDPLKGNCHVAGDADDVENGADDGALSSQFDGYESFESWAQDALDMEDAIDDGAPCSNGDALGSMGDTSSASADDDIWDDGPWLGDIHRKLGAKLGGKCMEGDSVKERILGAGNEDYKPFKNLTGMLLFVFSVKHQLSRVCMSDLFATLRYVDGVTGDGAGEGRAFDTTDIPLSGAHFVSRLRRYLPLFEVWVRDIPTKKSAGVGTSAKVYDIPISHVLDSLLRSPAAMTEMLSNPGGAAVTEEDAQEIGLGSEHLFPMATRPKMNARCNFMHGTLASSMPQYNSDGFISLSGRRVYISDMVMCDLRQEGSADPLQVPCRAVKSFYDEESERLVVVVRCFRNAEEVLGIERSNAHLRRKQLVRLWEEQGPRAEIPLHSVGQVLDLVEVLTIDEMREGKQSLPWSEGQRQEGWSFVAEGFVEHRRSGHYAQVAKRRGWSRAGAADENFPNMRAPDVNHNGRNLPFLNLTTSIHVDDFNVWGMTSAHSEGASYFALPTLDRRLLRLSRHLYPTTMADPGASYDAAMAFSGGVIGQLEKGCYARVIVPSADRGKTLRRQVFARGGLLSVCGDAPQRAGLLYIKGANQKTLHPCTTCNVTQSQVNGELGGDLGERNFNIHRNRRTRAQILDGRDKLREAGIGSSAAAELSKQLGIVEPDIAALPSVLYDLVSLHQPMESCCAELLHQNHLNHLSQVQEFFIGLLSPQGRVHVSGVLRQRDHLYGPGAYPLHDIVKNYSSLTGSHKALLGCIQLIVFRGILSSVGAMKQYLKTTALKQMRQEVWGDLSDNGVLDLLKQYLQASSALSFASRGQRFNDSDLSELHVRAGDYVSLNFYRRKGYLIAGFPVQQVANAKRTLGRQGVRTSSHNWLHWADTIRANGAPLDASIGEQGHQQHKRANKSGSGRDPAAHHARRANTLMSLRKLMVPGETWKASRHDYSLKKRVTHDVHAGVGCTRVLTALSTTLRGGIASPTDPDEGAIPTVSSTQRKFQGSARWNARVLSPAEGWQGTSTPILEQQGWEAAVAQSRIAPHDVTIRDAARTWYSCGPDYDEATCDDRRCPSCWEDSHLINADVHCSRFKHGVPPRVSSGLGRLKGGNVRSATNKGPTPRAWAVGNESGEDVEIYTHRSARTNGLSGDGHTTLAKILYFFDHEGNNRVGSSNEENPVMAYVLVYEYVTCGEGRSKKEDTVTKHPTYWLQGGIKTLPSVFPVDAIRRHVHMFHRCPLSSYDVGIDRGRLRRLPDPAPLSCRLHHEANAKGGGKVWRHHYNLASVHDGQTQRDAYMLNEHWHSVFQDGVV